VLRGDVIMANKPTAINEALSNAGVVVQIVEAPKAEYILQISEAQQIDKVVEMFSDGEATIGDGEELVTKSALVLGKVLMPDAGVACTYAKWGVVRGVWLRKFMAFNPHASEESAQKAWERQVKRVTREMPDVKKPSAPKASAVQMSEKRAKEKAELSAMLDSQLEEKLAAYKAADKFTKASAVKAEIVARANKANEGIEAEVKSARELIAKQVKLCSDLDLLNEISNMLPAIVMQAI